MGGHIIVFGTSHNLQGPENAPHRKTIDDPTYDYLVSELLEGKDFVFEEASGMGPTKAERLTLRHLGPDRYLDVDPHADRRDEFGIGKTGASREIEASNPDPLVVVFQDEQAKRELLWLKKIAEKKCHNALFICGYLHTLSMAFRLDSAGYEVQTYYYTPFRKLCGRQHADDSGL
jgi:hypothetical protein